MTAQDAQDYKTMLENEQLWGYFENTGKTYYGNGTYTFAQRCLILADLGDGYRIRYFDQETQTFTETSIGKDKITLDNEVEELAFWVVRSKVTGKYYSSSSNPSSCPSIYSTKGKASAAVNRAGSSYEVKKWVISERDA